MIVDYEKVTKNKVFHFKNSTEDFAIVTNYDEIHDGDIRFLSLETFDVYTVETAIMAGYRFYTSGESDENDSHFMGVELETE